MYSYHNIQVNYLIKKFVKVIKEENGHKIEISIQAEAAYQIELERNIFIKIVTEMMKNK